MGSLLFWRKTRDTGEYRPDGIAQTKVVEVSRDEPLPVQLVHPEDSDYPLVEIKGSEMPPVAGRTITRLVQVPGIGTGSAYAAGDAFGTLITFSDVFRTEKCSGTIVSAFFIDLDDEGIQKDVPIYIAPITATTDNSAAAPSDTDVLLCRGHFSISTFLNLGNNQIGTLTNIGLWVSGSDPNLYTQLVTQGADNIAASNIPWIGIVVVPD